MSRAISEVVIILIKFSLEDNQSKTTTQKLKLTLYYLSIVVFGNLLMFILMTYNFGIIMALILGNMIGFFLFGLNSKNREMHA